MIEFIRGIRHADPRGRHGRRARGPRGCARARPCPRRHAGPAGGRGRARPRRAYAAAGAYLTSLEQRAADLEREQHHRAALATAAERARITRELHDVVAHSVSVMVAQAQAAVAAQAAQPEVSTHAMGEVITVGRASLAEMRRLVGAFSGPADLAPAPGLGALPELVDRVRAAGVPVRLDVGGTPVALPSSVNLAAYRIVQEALTNTLKHAGPGAAATVRLGYRPGALDVEVADNGPGRPAGPAGNGLRGISERVRLLGGELRAGPGEGHGFTVSARLPTGQEPP